MAPGLSAMPGCFLWVLFAQPCNAHHAASTLNVQGTWQAIQPGRVDSRVEHLCATGRGDGAAKPDAEAV